MRHRSGYSRMNRSSDERKALLRGLSTQLILNGRILTTLEKAKALRPVVERLITMSKEDSLAHRRLAAAKLYDKDAVKRLFSILGPKNIERKGGYTRIMRFAFRPGDHARRAMIEFVDDACIAEKTAASVASI